MSHNFSDKLVKLVKKLLRRATLAVDESIDRATVYVWVNNKELQGLNEKDLDFLLGGSERVYVYVDDINTSVLSIPLKNLVEAGILSKVERNGLVYWLLAGEVMDPKKYIAMYKADPELHRTLHYVHGYTDIYDRFADLIEKKRKNVLQKGDSISSFSYAGFIFTLHRNRMHVDTHMCVPQHICEKARGGVSVSMTIRMPTAEDVYRASEYMEYTEHVVSEIVENAVEAVRRSTGHNIDVKAINGRIKAEDYRLVDINIELNATVEGEGTEPIKLAARYRYRRKSMSTDSTDHDKVFEVLFAMPIKSSYAYTLLRDTDWKKFVVLPDGVDIGFDGMTKSIVFSLSTYSIAPFDFEKMYMAVKMFRDILPSIGEKAIETMKDTFVVVKDVYSYDSISLGTVGDMLETVKWRKIGDMDEIVLKLVVLDLILRGSIESDRVRVEPPIVDYLVGLSALYGFDEDAIAKKVENPLETLIEFATKGKLRVVAEGRDIKLLFKGRPIEEYIDLNRIPEDNDFWAILDAAISFARPGEVKNMKRILVSL